MDIVRLDDFQSWRIDCSGHRLFVDPWLVDDIVIGPRGAWLHRSHASRAQMRPRDLKPSDLVVLTSARPDHAHRATLQTLDRRIRVVGPPAAMRLARRLGFRSTLALGPRSRLVLDGRLALLGVALPFPYRPGGATGVLVESLDDGVRALVAQRCMPQLAADHGREVDVLIGAVEPLSLLGVKLSSDLETCMGLARSCRARWVLASRTEPARGLGWLGRLLCRIEPVARDAFAATASLHIGGDRGRWLAPGESVSVVPRARPSVAAAMTPASGPVS